MKTETNDPMFPFLTYNEGGYGDTITFHDVNGSKQFFPFKAGLTKREYFAVMAMQGFLASSVSINNTNERTPELIASVAVITADALIKALNK